MAKLLPLILLLVGLGAGVGAGFALRPVPEADAAEAPSTPAPPPPPVERAYADKGDFVRLSNQFLVPLVTDDRVRGLVVLSISLEVAPGQGSDVHALEPKLRDAFLQVLFDHANSGGFAGAFTGASAMTRLRAAVREAGQGVLGPTLREVLILDLVRQDS